MPFWLYVIAIVSLATGGLCAFVIFIDLLSGYRQHMWIMNLVWPITALYSGPVGLWAYFRMGRNPVPLVYAESQAFSLGKAITVCEGSDLTIIAMGVMLALALDAADTLADQGIKARVLDMHTVKPLDGEAIERAAQETGAIVTAEDHNILGGLGGAVAEYLVEHTPVPVRRVGVPDTFGRSGDPAELFPMYGMAVTDIVTAAHDVLARKEATGPSLPPHRGFHR